MSYYYYWIGIAICLIHSALFSGLNLGFFGLSRLRLEVQAEAGDEDAIRILKIRKDAHLLLATLLWGNVASNVLLTLLTDSVMTGVGAFLFSTVGITFLGEILPQAYLSKHALRASFLLVPIIRLYQILLYLVAKPTALLLDTWLGREKADYFQEDEFLIMLKHHATAHSTDVEKLESIGAINFLQLDDILVRQEGEIINPQSVIALETNEAGLPLFPDFDKEPDDPFLQKLHVSDEKWVIITNKKTKQPVLVLNADQFLRDVVYEKDNVKSIFVYCHRPIVVTDPKTNLGEVILKLKVHARNNEDDVVDNDLILYWGKKHRIITGADILGRLLRGIAKRIDAPNQNN